MDWLNTGFYRDFGYGLVNRQVFPHHHRRSDQANAGAVVWGKEKTKIWLQVLDRHLLGTGNKYLCDDDITIADYFGAGMLSLSELIHCDLTPYPNLARWYDAMIKGLHHSVYRCRDSEETRRFYEDFLGLRLAGTLPIQETKTGRATGVLHTFYELGDGSYLAFFEAPDMPFQFKPQHDYDLHIAPEVDEATLKSMFEKGRAHGVETRGIVDHGFIHSIYFRDPNGYVIELTARTSGHVEEMDPARNDARAKLDRWQAEKSSHGPS